MVALRRKDRQENQFRKLCALAALREMLLMETPFLQ
jgi:hypothetical protein